MSRKVLSKLMRILRGGHRHPPGLQERLEKLVILKDHNEWSERYEKPFTKIGDHSKDQLVRLHANFATELGKIGRVDQGEYTIETALSFDFESIDFAIDSRSGSSVPIGIVVERKIPGTIRAIEKSLENIQANYSVNLDLDDANIVITKSGEIAILIDEEPPLEIISKIF